MLQDQLPHGEQETKRGQKLGIPFKGSPLVMASSSQARPPKDSIVSTNSNPSLGLSIRYWTYMGHFSETHGYCLIF